jgi:N-carbamoylputrescine amidase
MITLLIVGSAALAALVAGVSLRKKKATRETVAERRFDLTPLSDAVLVLPTDPEPQPTQSPDLRSSASSADKTGPQMTQIDADDVSIPHTDPEPLPDADPEPVPITEPEPQPVPEPPTPPEPTQPTIIVAPETPPHTDPEPLPDADPEPVPITEPEPQPVPEPVPTPEPPPPTIIVATELPQVSFKTYRVTEPRAAKPAEPVRAAVRPRASRIIRQPKSERTNMSRIVKGGLIQTSLACDTSESLDRIREAQTERTLKYIDQAGAEGVQILCMQEIFTGPYFCAEQTTRWYDSTEKIPDGPTTKLMQEYAKKYSMVIVVPLYEVEETGVYYNTAAVIDADGKYLGKYRKNHIPHVAPGFWEKFYFRPGNLGYPVFETAYAKVGVYICYDRHFPEGARELGLAGAEIVMNPSATVAGLSEYLWKLEQPAHAVANGYFVGAINRVGYEAPWNIGEFYGQSYFCDPRGQMLAVGPRDADALVTAELDLDKIREVRNTWQFYRDRRPETYNGIVRL